VRNRQSDWKPHENFTLRRLFLNHSRAEIAQLMARSESTVKNHIARLGLRKGRRVFTEADKQLLRERYADTPTPELAKQLGITLTACWQLARRLNLHKSKQFIADTARDRTMRPGHGGLLTRFQPGLQPWNKGRKLGAKWSTPGMRRTQFKKGQRPMKWRPIGSTRINADGYMERKVADISHDQPYWWKCWRMEHVLVWEKKHRRKVPKGRVIVFKDGNKRNLKPSNLQCITRQELVHRNRWEYQHYPLQLRRLILATGKLDNLLRRKGKHAGQK
jgi:hypothetical protein